MSSVKCYKPKLRFRSTEKALGSFPNVETFKCKCIYLKLILKNYSNNYYLTLIRYHLIRTYYKR